MPFSASRAPTSIALLGAASLLSLASCLDFDRYGEAPVAGAGGAPSGGAPAAGAPSLGGGATEGGSGGSGGEGGAPLPVCGDGVLDATEECDDALGPPGACIACQVVCSDDGETKLGAHCYYLDPDGDLNWQAARTACNLWRKGASLASVETADEQTALQDLFFGTIWLGGGQVDSSWVWASGEPFGFVNWDSAMGQPNDPPNERCMGVWQDSTAWHDMQCQNTNQYLCEWEPPSRQP